MIGLQFVVSGIVCWPISSAADESPPDETFVAIETSLFNLTMRDVVATVTFMTDRDGVWHCMTDIVAQAGREPKELSNRVRLEFQAPCEEIYREESATFDLRTKRERRAGAIEGSFFLRDSPATPSRAAWSITRISAVSETVAIESRPDCTLSGTYNGYGLSYINPKEDANYPVDVSMHFHARVITQALFNNLRTRCEQPKDGG